MSENANRVCPTCGNRFVPEKPNHVFCSFACYQQKAYKERQCKLCGKTYNGPRWQEYCSNTCRCKANLLDSLHLGESLPPDLDEKTIAEDFEDCFPFIPSIVGTIAYQQIMTDDANDSSNSSQVLKRMDTLSNTETVAKTLNSLDGAFSVYYNYCASIITNNKKVQERNSELQEQFCIDTGAFLRTFILQNSKNITPQNAHESTIFKRGMMSIRRISGHIAPIHFRRCRMCHMVGNEEVHFRKVKIAGKWSFDEFCIYCNRKELYDDFKKGYGMKNA